MTDLLTVPRVALATALGVATAVRGARVFHPHGATRTCRVVVDGGQVWAAGCSTRPPSTKGVVRVSRGVGLPAPAPAAACCSAPARPGPGSPCSPRRSSAGWLEWGELTLGEPVDGERLRFRPTVGADDLEPVELFRTVRAWSYDASQARWD